MTPPKTIAQLELELVRARAKMERASEARRLLPAGSSRARITTANARWSIACEAHDRIQAELSERRSQAGAA